MSTLSQSIPNFLSGISQQPDNRKRPGQVKDAVNVFPDFALGMLKRPGGKFISKLHGAAASGKWFEILRDSNEKYIGQYADNVFRIWDLANGHPKQVDMGSNTGVPGTCNLTVVKSTADALEDARDALAAKLLLLQAAEDDLVETTNLSTIRVNQLFSTNVGYTPPHIEEFITDGVVQYPDGSEIFIINKVIQETLSTPHPVIAVSIKNAGTDLSTGSTANNATVTTGSGTGLTLNVTVDSDGCVSAVSIGNSSGTNYRTGDTVTISALAGAEFTIHALEKGTERTNDYPLVASKGQRVYDLMQSVAPTKFAADILAKTNAYNDHLSKTSTPRGYVQLDGDLSTAETNYTNAVNNCAITTIPANGYLKDATPEDIELLTVNDTTFVLNKKKTVAYTSNKTHSSGFDAHRAHVTINIAANSTQYTVSLNGTDFSHTSPGSAAEPTAIAAALATAITANNAFTATQIGPGLYITSNNAFTVGVKGGSTADGISAISETTANVNTLPLQTKNGYIVTVKNAQDVDIDDQYLIFKTHANANFGAGQWEETAAPDLNFEFDPLTMPHQLISNANGTFTFGPISWKTRKIGDNNSNKTPSFVGNEIKHIFFYRGRMGFLSEGNVTLSKADDIFDFWNTTAQTVTNDDRIDISVVGKKPVFLQYVLPTSVGLVLYSQTEQFLLTTDSDILSPTTAKVNTMSAYECDPNVEAVSLGISQAFVSKTPLYTRLFELTDISTDIPPLMSDVTNYVPELIPAAINSMVASPDLSIVSLGQTGNSTVYQYRFLNQSREKRVINSWYKWDLTGTLLDQFFDRNTLYMVVKNGSDVYVQSFDVSQSNELGFLSLPTGEKTDVCLDLFSIDPHRTYNSTTDKTKIFLPYDSVTGKKVSVLVLGDVGSVFHPTIGGNAGDQFVEIDGDYRGIKLAVGYIYDMTIDLPKIYQYSVSDGNVNLDDVSSLVIHRLKFKVGLSGPVDYKVIITGINDWTKDVTVTLPQQYNLNNVNMQASSTHVVPIFQRNENLLVQIIGNTPFPVSLLGLDWEGKINNRFYRRG